jgi:ribosomal protein L11 methyltransferase
MRHLCVTVEDGAEDLAELLRDLEGQPSALPAPEPTALQAAFDDREPEGLEDRIEVFLQLIDPQARAQLWTARDGGPWLEGWRAVYSGVDVGRFQIRPPWLAERNAILIDPRGAFGSGSHPSTRLALKLLDEVIDGYQGKRMLDVGAGSGILAIAAAKHGLISSFIELEPAAREACRRTAALNGVPLRELERLEGEFDLICANLPAETLYKLLPQLKTMAKTLICSGSRDASGKWIASIV